MTRRNNPSSEVATVTYESLTLSNDELIAVSDILGISVKNEQALYDSIINGLSSHSVKDLQKILELNATEMSSLLRISPRTLSRRKANGKLNVDESRRIFLLAAMSVVAKNVLEGHESALRWLKSPKKAFNGEVPLNHTATDKEIREVIDLLHQIEHGVFH